MARVPPQLERLSMRACEKREVIEWITFAKEQPQIRETVVLDLCERELNASIGSYGGWVITSRP